MSAFNLNILDERTIRMRETRNLARALYAWREQAFIVGPFASRVKGGAEYDGLLVRHGRIVREHRDGGA